TDLWVGRARTSVRALIFWRGGRLLRQPQAALEPGRRGGRGAAGDPRDRGRLLRVCPPACVPQRLPPPVRRGADDFSSGLPAPLRPVRADGGGSEHRPGLLLVPVHQSAPACLARYTARPAALLVGDRAVDHRPCRLRLAWLVSGRTRRGPGEGRPRPDVAG